MIPPIKAAAKGRHGLAWTVAACLSLVAPRVEAAPPSPAPPTPLPHAHAHNDYYHSRPLLDALDRGFCSVEADIFLVDGKLLVGHARDELRPARTLQALYLDPLVQRIADHGGRVYPAGPPFTLLIDIKSDGPATYRTLHEQLAPYADILTHFPSTAADPVRGPVVIVVSGNRPFELIEQSQPRYVGIDGRLPDLDSPRSAELMPLISDNWRNHFRWRGEGPMPTPEQEKLAAIVQQAHQAGRRVRFWATPEEPRLWRTLQRAGVDLINTDQLDRLREVLLNIQEAPAAANGSAPNR